MSQAYLSLPNVHSYAQALRIATETKPIRGRANELIPLGRRSDADQFSIQVNENKDVVLCMHNLPAITYHPNDTLTLHPYNYGGTTRPYWTASCTKFIYSVLRPFVLNASTRSGMLVLDISHVTGTRLVIPAESTRMKLNHADKTIAPVADPQVLSLRLNRAATNNVRKRFGTFYRYLKGMVAVRKQMNDKGEFHVLFDLSEVTAVIPNLLREGGPRQTIIGPCAYVNRDICALSAKPPKMSPIWSTEKGEFIRSAEPFEKWEKAAQEYVQLITPVEDEQTQTDNFYRAFVLLLAQKILGAHLTSKEHLLPVSYISEMADEILFKIHSDEVFERVPTKPGQVPSRRYESWLTRENGRI